MRPRAILLGTFVVGLVVAGLAASWVIRHTPAPPDAAAPVAFRMPPQATFAPVFEPCAHCHEIGAGARITNGPPLTGIVGRKAGTRPGYPYSDALRNSGLVWDEATLARFLAAPSAVVPGTRMVFPGLPADRIPALLAFLKSVPETPAPDGGGR